jgi:hypothetical protein
MAQFMKDFGRKIYTMEGVSCIMLVVIYMRVSSLMIWPRDLVFINMRMEVSMLGIGIKINNMDLEKKNGMMAANIRDFIRMHQKRAKENTVGRMEILILENGETTCSMEKGCSSGMMIGYILVIGRII